MPARLPPPPCDYLPHQTGHTVRSSTGALKTSQKVLLQTFLGWSSGQDFVFSVILFSEWNESNRAETKILNYAKIKMLPSYCYVDYAKKIIKK